MHDSTDKTPLPKADFFTTTHWSVVIAAQVSDADRKADALARLCEVYWYPLYAFVRKRGYSKHEAQDLTQSFFEQLLSRDFLNNVDSEKGKFRTFLLAAMKHFLANEWDRSQAQKRGGGQQIISIDTDDAEGRYRLEPVDSMSADKIYERRWAMTVLDQAMITLRGEQSRPDLFDELKSSIVGDKGEHSYAEIGSRYDMNEGAIKVVAHRLRKRYRQLIREEIEQSVTGPEDVDAEIQHLFEALRAS